ncbi:HEAT repeat domain-containing protein [Marinobacterium weihaiense]|uniref:HEAT repeat domain-containing protein n=1 Tax=Marinobacterium weihaiense TaxID=2851016 RepID=A0ABS6MDW1_9GAMM|nr:HEAT repeat domain-containing protein [Marinobacterium weihaiense]MBV0934492.1 HEAT repeat domain-containing protein [Marinobacterium weihaiense]
MTEMLTAERRLNLGLIPHWQRLHRRQSTALLARHRRADRPWRGTAAELDQPLLDTLLEWTEEQNRLIGQLHTQQQVFSGRLSRALTEADIQAHVLDYARVLGAGYWQLRADRKAFRRWFGVDAVVERYQQRVADAERHLAFALQQTGRLSQAYLQSAAQDPHELGIRWRRLKLERQLGELLRYDGDLRVRLAAFRALSAAIQALPVSWHAQLLSLDMRNYIDRLALDTHQPVWLQAEALSLLDAVDYAELTSIVSQRLQRRGGADDFFVREHAVGLLGGCQRRTPDQTHALWPLVLQDPSETVRQALARQLVQVRPAQMQALLLQLIQSDTAACVRGASVHALLRLLETAPDCVPWVAEQVLPLGQQETDTQVLRLYCHLTAAVAALPEVVAEPLRLALWAEHGMALLNTLHTQSKSVKVRRWAALSRESLWALANPEARRLREQLAPWLAAQPVQRRKRLPEVAQKADPALLGRVLSELVQADFSLDIDLSGRRRTVRRWEVFGFRFWRAWHEFWRPATDKREAGRHTIGRLYYGLLQIPSARLAELSPTRVPGEPLHISDEDGWRPYLPLVDQCISCLDQGWPTRPMQIFSSEGVTEVMPPAGFWGRLKARIRLTLGFARFAERRNWQPGSEREASHYILSLQTLGFRIRFRPHTGLDQRPLQADPLVQRFFPAFALPPLILELWGEYSRYFVSLYQNTLQQLVVFLGGMLTLFLGRHLAVNWLTRRARNALPLVIGGWGTRGKSGTERLKAALFNGLGYHVVSKTTGCEAMFLHSYSHGELREMFLFRPYDKATIWEQAGLVRLAARLKADVFLWECMGLTPAYVRILQQQWMRDDLATITNTYPDHEDLQGPAGIDIPIAMTEFIPSNSALITTEEEMQPILQQAARNRQTVCQPVSWIESALLPGDILSRFPYEEHPANIALVLRLAEMLDIPRPFALKAMADHVVPDLGVLQVYPEARLQGRRLEFTNGMSANERLGALGNWTRLGFDQQDTVAEPGVWITTVINNRADRVARSQVFADILVRDITADCHVLIGSNLEGFMGYVETAWEEYRPQLTLWPQNRTAAGPLAHWQAHAERLRVPVSEDAVRQRLQAMLAGLGHAMTIETLDPEHLHWHLPEALAPYHQAIQQVYARYHREWREYAALAARIEQVQEPDDVLDQAAATQLWTWLQARIHVVPVLTISGEELLQQVCAATPPGYHNRIMGLQNIKGPGLDWVYTWQAWEKLHAAAMRVLSAKASDAGSALQFLANLPHYGILAHDFLLDWLAQVRTLPLTQNEAMQAEIRLIEIRLQAEREEAVATRGSRDQEKASSGLWSGLLQLLENFLDVGDAIKRRRTANRIYRDLSRQQISSSRAAEELKALNQRQKGGWLLRRLSSRA